MGGNCSSLRWSDAFEGEVTLTGAVDTEAEKKRAESIALSTAGVKKVHNLLKLKHE
ncbi:MAG: hypothetical protein DRH11_15360 [Deltaproteobacteria bacterium]|nr:MAG: hypothetical protein DRH11_15360 [Deltaproteobacteria bacterium]